MAKKSCDYRELSKHLNTAATYSRNSPASVGWRGDGRKPWSSAENSLQATN